MRLLEEFLKKYNRYVPSNYRRTSIGWMTVDDEWSMRSCICWVFNRVKFPDDFRHTIDELLQGMNDYNYLSIDEPPRPETIIAISMLIGYNYEETEKQIKTSSN